MSLILPALDQMHAVLSKLGLELLDLLHLPLQLGLVCATAAAKTLWLKLTPLCKPLLVQLLLPAYNLLAVRQSGLPGPDL